MNYSSIFEERGASAALSVAVLILVAGSALGGYSYYHNSQAREEAIDSLKGYGLTAEQAENFHEERGDSGFVLPWESAPDYGDTPEKREVLNNLGEDYGAWTRILGDGFTQEAARRALNGDADGDNMANAEDPHPLRHDHPVTSEYENEVPLQVLRALRPLDGDLELDRNDRALAQRLAAAPENVLLRQGTLELVENVTKDGVVTNSELGDIQNSIYRKKHPVTTYAENAGLPENAVNALESLDLDYELDRAEENLVDSVAEYPENALTSEKFINRLSEVASDQKITSGERGNILIILYLEEKELPENTRGRLSELQELGGREKELLDSIANYPESVLTSESFLDAVSDIASDGGVSVGEYGKVTNPLENLLQDYDLPQWVENAARRDKDLKEQYWTGTQVEDYFRKISSLSSDDLRTFRDRITSDLRDGVSGEEISQYDHPVALYGELKGLPENVVEQLEPLKNLWVHEEDFVGTLSEYPEGAFNQAVVEKVGSLTEDGGINYGDEDWARLMGSEYVRRALQDQDLTREEARMWRDLDLRYPENTDQIWQKYQGFENEAVRDSFLEAAARAEGDVPTIVDRLDNLASHYSTNEVYGWVLDDGKFAPREMGNVEYGIQAAAKGDPLPFTTVQNPDNDSIPTWFEMQHSVEDNGLYDPGKTNETFLFSFSAVKNRSQNDFQRAVTDKFVNKLNIPRKNTVEIIEDPDTPENEASWPAFKDAVDNLAARVDNNDFVYSVLHSHGWKTGLVIPYGSPVPDWPELGEELRKLEDARANFRCISACYAGYAQDAPSMTREGVVLATPGRGAVGTDYLEPLYAAAFGDPGMTHRPDWTEHVEKTMEFLDEMDAGPTYSVKELHDATAKMLEWYGKTSGYGPELSNPDLAAKIFVNYTADAGPDYIQKN